MVLAGSVEEPHEGSDPTPHSPYTAAKWSATAYARMFFALWDVRVSVLQIAMVYGPAQPDLTKLVPYVTLAFMRGDSPQLSSGTRLVDWVYVDDVVDALVRTAETDTTIGRVLDIGSGRLVSIRDTVELLALIVGGEARPQFSAVADRPMDLARRADPRTLQSCLTGGHRPRWRTGFARPLRGTPRTVAVPAREPVHARIGHLGKPTHMATEPFQRNDAQDHDDWLRSACQGAPPMITMRSIRPNAVAALGAHCDDIAIGAGATLLFMCSANPGLRVDVLVLSGGGTEREDEEHAALAAFCPGADLRITVLKLPDGRLPAHWDEAKAAVEDLREQTSPDLLFAPNRFDAHQDHRGLAEAGADRVSRPLRPGLRDRQVGRRSWASHRIPAVGRSADSRRRSTCSMSTIPRRYTVRGTIARLFLDWRASAVSSAGLDTPRRSMSTRSLWIFRGVEIGCVFVLTCSQAYLGAAMHRLLAESSMPAAGSGPFGAGSGSIDDTLRPR